MLIVNALRPTDYVAVIVWDVMTIYGIYLVLPAPLHFQMLLALLLTGGGSVLWLIHRLGLAETYETIAVLAAYSFTNAFGIFVSRRLNQSHRQQFVLLMQERKAREELEIALAEVKTLRGIIPICSYCRKIRNDEGYYEVVEKYIMEHSEAVFSHTYCPECFAEHYPDYIEE
jgi:ABC-type transport system involved in cytochrome bd biosynthesis fused ATPase/permease subunit